MRRGKRALLLAVCAAVVAAFALTGCAGGVPGAQVTKEQYKQIFTKMVEAFPNVPQKANAAMAAEESELLNFTIHETHRILDAGQSEQELQSFKKYAKSGSTQD